MSNPYGGPGNPVPTSAQRGLSGVIAIVSAWLGASGVGFGSISAFEFFRTVDSIRKPSLTDDKYDAWKLASEFHKGLEALLIVSVLMALVLIVGSFLSMIGKPSGRPLEIIGSAWVFIGGLFSVTFGGEHGLAAESFAHCYMIVIGAALGLISLVLTMTRPTTPQTQPQYVQYPPTPMLYQAPRP
ncbi:hypothetical protein ABZ942_08240 [Nocardia sp. NPDC046473]|uniref:hypothetical protein n=1 Tax=Nocardia sp. NPDC046473 TaxID=3155733 RepID=UPI003408C377